VLSRKKNDKSRKASGRGMWIGPAPGKKGSGTPSSYLSGDLFDHTLLTREEEVEHGRRVVRARKLRDAVAQLLESRRLEEELREGARELGEGVDWDLEDGNDLREMFEKEEGTSSVTDYDCMSYELEHLSVYGCRPADVDENDLPDHLDHTRRHMEQLSKANDGGSADGGANFEYDPWKRAGRGATAAERRSYTPLLRVPLGGITDDDAVTLLGLPGGRRELLEALLAGADARESLRGRNAKLVVSISRNWLRRAYSTEGANGGSSVYEGSWDRPGLDECVQEGMIGLARAADKYDPERGLRFSTYATHWITSTVRLVFQRSATGCLRVPSQLHEIRARYQRIVRESLEVGGETPGLSPADIAREIGVTEKRLKLAVRATSPLLSLDAPVNAGWGSLKGSGAGGDVASGDIILLDTLTR